MAELKRVTFKVAKAIKEAGYPQGHTAMCYDTNGVLCDWHKADAFVDAPFVLEVWLWLWREKGIYLNTDTGRKDIVCIYWDDTIIHEIKDMRITDPEEAIIAAIEHIVDNKLLK